MNHELLLICTFPCTAQCKCKQYEYRLTQGQLANYGKTDEHNCWNALTSHFALS